LNKLSLDFILFFHSFDILIKKSFLKNQDNHHTHKYGRIGYIENRPQRGITSSPQGDPTRYKPFPNVNVEHVHNLAMKPGCACTKRRIFQPYPIKHTVN